jgi:hypothetical protein
MSAHESDATRYETGTVLQFAGRQWWFPISSTDLDSAEFESRNDRVYLLQRDGSAVEGLHPFSHSECQFALDGKTILFALAIGGKPCGVNLGWLQTLRSRC